MMGIYIKMLNFMNKIEVYPFDGIGDVKLGMTQDAVRAVIDGPVDEVPAHSHVGIDWPKSDYFLGSAIHVTYEPKTGLIDWIGINDSVPFDLRFKGLSLFKAEASEVIAHTEQYGALDTEDEELGYSFCFPKLGICFWRSSSTDVLIGQLEEAGDDEETQSILEDIEKSKYFQQISIFTKQYWD